MRATVATAVLAFVSISTLACTPPADRTPTPAATAAPTAAPTPTPMSTYWPSYADFDVIARQKSGYSAATEYYAGYAAIYVARECFAERLLTREGFQAFVDQTLFMANAEGKRADKVLTEEVVGKMFALADAAPQRTRPLTPQEIADKVMREAGMAVPQGTVAPLARPTRGEDVAGSCIEPYMYPQNSAEAALGQALVWHGIWKVTSPNNRSTAAKIFKTIASRWFQQPAESREPLVSWLWNEHQLAPPTQIPDDTAVPRGGTLPPNWTSDYQLERLEARIRELESESSQQFVPDHCHDSYSGDVRYLSCY